MKKKAMVLFLIVCLFSISISMSVASDQNEFAGRDYIDSGDEIVNTGTDPFEYQEVRYANGFNNDTIKIAFRDGDFTAAEKYFFYAATNQWAWESRSTERSLHFDFNSSYKEGEEDGIYVKRDLLKTESGEIVTSRAVCRRWIIQDDTVHYATIIFNNNTNFTTAKSKITGPVWIGNILIPETAYFPSTALHELGHAMGLGHVDAHDTTALMHSPRPRAEDLRDYVRIINATDRANFRQIYDRNTSVRTSFMMSSELKTEENYFYLRKIPENNQTYDFVMDIEICYEPISDSEVIDQSDLIIKGRVKEILPTEWTTPDGRPVTHNNIFEADTFSLFHSVVVEVDETYKGELQTNEIIIHKLGGTSGNIKVITSNPNYYENEGVILYLKEGIDDSGTYYTQIGRSQIFLIDEDLGVNGVGEKVNISELINTILNQQDE